MNVPVHDNLRLIKARLRNQKLVANALTNQQGEDQGVAPDTLVNPVQLYHQTDETTLDASLEQYFKDIMRQYISDDNIIDDLFKEIGPVAGKEFVLNYNNYIPKLKQIEGQRFNKSKLFALFNDMLSENLTKKGLLIPDMSNRDVKRMGSVDSNLSTPTFRNHQMQQLMNPNYSMFTPLRPPFQPPVPRSSPATPSDSPAELPGIKEEEEPMKGPKEIQNAQLDNVNTDVARVVEKALEKLKAFLDDNKLAPSAQGLKNILGNNTAPAIFGLDNVSSYMADGKKVNHNKDSLIRLFIKTVRERRLAHDFETIKKALLAIKIIKDTDINDNPYQALYISQDAWLQSRRNLAQSGNYKGYGIPHTSLKSHHILMGKYYLDRQKLGNGILDIRYARNKHLTKIKPQFVSENMKNVVNKIVDEKKVDKADYHKLNSQEQHLVRNLDQMFELGGVFDDDDSFSERFNIVIGELRAGNTNMALKEEAKKYILHAMRINKIPRNVGYDLMHELM
jgi:hypothetical protein